MSAQTIVIILDIVFFVLLVLGFLIGFWRGVKRSALEIAITIICIVIAGFLTPVVTNAILNISVGDGKTLNQYVIDIVMQEPNVATFVENSPSLAKLFEALPQFLLCAVVFLILNLAVGLVGYIVYKIISAIAFKSKKKEKELGLKRNRWVGGAIGVLKTFIFMLVIFMPLTSLTKLAGNTMDSMPTTQASEEMQTDADQNTIVIPEQLTNAISGINSSFFGVLNGAVGLDDFIFDDISKFKIDDESVYLRKDIEAGVEVYKAYSSMSISSDTKLSQIDWDEMDALYEKATGMTIYNFVVLNVVSELVENYENIVSVFPEINEYAPILNDVREGLKSSESKTKYFADDIDKIYSIFSGLAREGFFDDLANISDFEQYISSFVDQHKNLVAQVLKNFTDINIVKDSFSSVVDMAIARIDLGEFENVFSKINTQIKDWKELGQQLNNVLVSFSDLSKAFKNQGTSFGEVFDDLTQILTLNADNVNDILGKFGKLLDSVDSLEIAKTSTGEKLLPQILEIAGIKDGNLLDVKGEKITNYQEFFEFVSEPINKIIELDVYSSIKGGFDLNSILTVVANAISVEEIDGAKVYSSTLSDIILPLYKIAGVHDLIFSEIIESSSSSQVVDLSILEEAGYETNFEQCFENWNSELPLISQVLFELNSRSYNENQTMLQYILSGGDINEVIKSLDDEAVDLIVPPIMQAKSLKPLRDKLSQSVLDKIKDVVDETVEVSLDLNNATYDPNNAEDQSQEIAEIVKSLVAILKQGDLTTLKDMDQTLLGNLMENIKLNAYRNDIDDIYDKKEEGVFKSVFDALISQAEAEFDVSFTEVFNVTNIYEVDFTEVFTLIQLASETKNAFAEAFKDLAISGNTTAGDSIDTIVGAIKDESNQELAGQILEITSKYDIQVDVDEKDKAVIEGKLEELEKEEGVDQSLIEGLKKLFGVSING